MPLHLAELKKHTAQNEIIIELLTKLTQTQQPKKEVVLNKPKTTVQSRGKRNGNQKQ
jgi:hypothetical protein